jgi:phage terminase small subunit
MTSWTNKQRLFVEHYLQCWNGTEAARLAGYRGNDATLASIASENLRKPKIRAEIERRIAAEAISANEVLWQLGKQAKGSIADFLTVSDDGEVKVDLRKVKELGHLLKKVHFDGDRIKIELYDAQAALVHIGKHHGLFKERHEHSGPDGGPIPIFDVEEWKTRRGDRLSQVEQLPDQDAGDETQDP